MEQAKRQKPQVQELRTPDGHLLGKIKRGRWLVIRRGGDYFAFDLWRVVEVQREHRPLGAENDTPMS